MNLPANDGLAVNEMKRGTASLVYFSLLVVAVLLLTACRGDSDPATATPVEDATPSEDGTPSAAADGTPATTVEAEATSSTDETDSSTESEASDDQLIATPTLPPTPTPGPVDNLVADLVEDSAVEDISFLGLTSEDWINLVISLLVVLLGYVLAGWFIGVALRWLVQRSGIEVADVFLKKFSGQLRWLVVILLAAFATFRLVFLSEAAIRLFRAMYFSIFLWTVFYVLWELIGYRRPIV